MIGRDSLYRLQTRRTSAQDGVLQNFSEREAASAPFARSTASMQGPRPCRFSSLQLNGRDFLRRCDVSCLNFAQFAQQAGNLRWQPLYRCRAVPAQNLILATPDGAYELELRTLRKTTHLQGRSATSFRRRYILLTPFDWEMRRKGYQRTRWADDWVITCSSAAEARAAVAAARKILEQLGVQLHPHKTRIVHVRHGFEFLGYKVKRGRELRLSPGMIRSGAKAGALYAYPREKSIRRFMDQVRARTRRRIPLTTQQLIGELNPLVRGWGVYYKRAHVRKLFHRLDGWIRRRIWSRRHRRWRCAGWKDLPATRLYGEYGLVNLVRLIPSLATQEAKSS
jgi:hypothetical protein